MSSVDIPQVIESIRQEAAKKKQEGLHPDRQKIRAKKIQIRPTRASLPVRALRVAKRERLRILKRVFALPFIGYAAKWLINLLRLPTRLQQLYGGLEDVDRRIQRLESINSKYIDHSRKSYNQLVDAMAALEAKVAQGSDDLEANLKLFHEKVEAFSKETRSNVSTIADRYHKLLSRIEERPASSSSASLDAAPVEAKSNPALDRFYYDFENRFRGSEEQIKEKQSKYLPYFENAPLDLRKEIVLDIGCGRGEWLRTMREHGFKAFGLDINQVMIEECKRANLEVQEVDVFAYLSNLGDESIGAITGFHIVEHLPFRVLIHLFDEVVRVLKPGGIAVFETPNPENLIVGSCNFYTDPTHINPIPPHTLAFMLGQRGFAQTDVIRLSPMRELPNMDGPLLTEIAQWLYKEQDYAVIATKVDVRKQLQNVELAALST